MKHKLSNLEKRLDELNSKVSSNLYANQTVEVTARENAKNAISSEEVIIQEIRKSKARIEQSLHNLECRPSEIVHTEIVAQTSRESQTKWRVAPKRKTGAAANHLLKQAADCTTAAVTDWLNHRAIEPLNEKSQIAQEYGLLPANARQQFAEEGKAIQRSTQTPKKWKQRTDKKDYCFDCFFLFCFFNIRTSVHFLCFFPVTCLKRCSSYRG